MYWRPYLFPVFVFAPLLWTLVAALVVAAALFLRALVATLLVLGGG